ncbi:MAG: hypothetical protein U0V72_01410 [Cytophagales bacterium]
MLRISDDILLFGMENPIRKFKVTDIESILQVPKENYLEQNLNEVFDLNINELLVSLIENDTQRVLLVFDKSSTDPLQPVLTLIQKLMKIKIKMVLIFSNPYHFEEDLYSNQMVYFMEILKTAPMPIFYFDKEFLKELKIEKNIKESISFTHTSFNVLLRQLYYSDHYDSSYHKHSFMRFVAINNNNPIYIKRLVYHTKNNFKQYCIESLGKNPVSYSFFLF